MNREDLLKHVEVVMSVAKTNLLEKGKVLPHSRHDPWRKSASHHDLPLEE
jgi:hypothetical protein